MALSLVPCRVIPSVLHLDPRGLRDRGVKAVLADLDNTLARYREPLPSPALTAWKEALAAEGVALFVVSNSRSGRRCPTFCQALGVDYIRHARKPGVKGIRQALEALGCRGDEAVMVGDQIFTDTLGANRAGVFSYLVEPIALDTLFRKARYAVEAPFREKGRRNGETPEHTISQERK